MRIRYSTWSMAAVLLVTSAVSGHAATPNSGAADPSAAAKPAVTAAKKPAPASSATKKPSATPVHSTAKRHSTAHPALLVHAQTAPAPSRISEIQTALAKDGAYQGAPNGRWDAATVDAMRQFQNEHSLNPSGKIDALTLQKLGLGSQVAGMGAPMPVAVPQASVADSALTERP
jgi:peptidoglycan hydrolase-like protein with peptidoglycan-binding domain